MGTGLLQPWAPLGALVASCGPWCGGHVGVAGARLASASAGAGGQARASAQAHVHPAPAGEDDPGGAAGANKPARATLETIAVETPTCVRLALRLEPAQRFAFEAGQWVDLWPVAASADEVGARGRAGGYSIASAPAALARNATIELVVKRSRHPVATWLHDHARVGDAVLVAAGGGDALRVDRGELPHHVVLVAGGIGITPLASVLRHITDVVPPTAAAPSPPVRVSVLYSAKCEDEFALLPALRAAAEAAAPRVAVNWHLRVTGERARVPPGMRVGRLGAQDVADEVAALVAAPRGGGACVDARSPTAFVCGPPAMADAAIAHLEGAGVPRARIKCERWW